MIDGATQMDVKSTLKVINEKDYPGRRGVTDGQTYQRLVGWPEVQETDRVRIGRATYKPGTYEQLHWHPIEACYYVISGHATVRDIEGREYEVSAGSIIYAPPGIAGAHEWEVKVFPVSFTIQSKNHCCSSRLRCGRPFLAFFGLGMCTHRAD